jgi:hypothetical protein
MSHRHGCHREDHPHIGRRELLQVGGLGLFGAGLADLMRLEAEAAPAAPRGRARAVIFIFQSGGPSQFETWDPKPDAPSEIRGEYGTVATRLPGVRFCEYLPRLAARADRFTVVKTMHHVAGRESLPDLPGQADFGTRLATTGGSQPLWLCLCPVLRK